VGASGEITVKMTYSRTLANSAGAAADKLEKNIRETFGDGTGDNQIQDTFSDDDAATTTPTLLDFNALPTPDGTVNLSRLKGLLVINDDATESLKVGGGTNATLAAPAEVTLPPGGVYLIVAPNTGILVTGGSTDILKIEAVSGTCDYVIAIIGF
jgi:hypothetical protein